MTMEIRSLRIDFDNDILEINGELYKKKMIVDLPASDGWKLHKLFNGDENNIAEKSDRLDINFISSTLNPEGTEDPSKDFFSY